MLLHDSLPSLHHKLSIIFAMYPLTDLRFWIVFGRHSDMIEQLLHLFS